MKQPTPNVTDADVVRVVRRDFAPQDIPTVTALLDAYGTAEWQREAARVRLAVLKLASGNVERVRTVMQDAKIDYRDVLSGAEYPAYSTKGFRTNELPSEERDRIIAEDWKQYQQWLKQ